MESFLGILTCVLLLFLFGLAVRERVQLFAWLRLNETGATTGPGRKEGLMRAFARQQLKLREAQWKLDDLSMELDTLNKGK